jgi:hypothetical protein
MNLEETVMDQEVVVVEVVPEDAEDVVDAVVEMMTMIGKENHLVEGVNVITVIHEKSLHTC